MKCLGATCLTILSSMTPDVWRKAAADVKQGSSDEGVEGYESLFDFEGISGDCVL